MSKYWGLIVVSRPHVFSLGSHDDFDKAAAFAKEFVDRKNEEIRQEVEEKNIPAAERPSEYDLLWVLNESDMRHLIGEVHRPFSIAKPKREEVGIEAPVRRGGATPNTPNNTAAADETPTQEAVDSDEV